MEKGNVVSLEDRIPKLKQQRRKKANRRLIVLLLLFFSMIVFVIYFQSPLSRVKEISISGNQTYTTEELIAVSGLSKKTNIWKVDKGAIEGRLKELPEISGAEIETRLPNTVVIKVAEHNRIAYIAKEKSFLPVLENGMILSKQEITDIPVNAPLLLGFKEGDVLLEMIDSLESLPREVLNAISEIHYSPKKTDEYHITLYMNDGFEVSATLRSFSEKMAHYPSIISQLDPGVSGVIDLEVGSYFKAYGPEGDDSRGEEEEEEGER